MPKSGCFRRIVKGCGVVALLGALGVGGLLGSLWLEHRTEVTLPAPTGPFPVGRVTYDWVDPSATDPLAPKPGAQRELLVWIWYPSVPGKQVARLDNYLAPAVRAARAHAKQSSWPFDWLTRDPSRVHRHSLRDPGVSPRKPTYPVVIFRSGASAPVTNYSTLLEDLASHGYVVVAFDAPYRTSRVVFQDGRTIDRLPENNPELASGDALDRLADRLLAAWTGDIAFVLDRLAHLNAADESVQLAGRLDLARVGVFGHSFGGATAAQFCHQDSRCKAGIDIDGAVFGSVVREGLDRPFLFLLSDHGDVSASAESRKIYGDVRSIYDRLPADKRSLATIRGANHFTFSDDGAVLKSRLVRGVLRAFGKLGIDGRRQLAVTAYCVHRFFDAYLKRLGDMPPELASPQYSEVRVLR